MLEPSRLCTARRPAWKHSEGVAALKKFTNSGQHLRHLRSIAFDALTRLAASQRRRARIVAALLMCAMLTNTLSLDSSAAPRREAPLDSSSINAKATGAVAGLTGAVAGIGVGVYFAVQHAHTVKGCVSDTPNGLLLQTDDGKIYVLLGATTDIQADQRIKVRGTKRKKIDGVTDQPSFVVEKLGKVYGSCTVTPNAP